MIDFLIEAIHNPRFLTMLFAAIAASATVYTLVMPLFAGESLNKRMKAVASERERIRARERDRLNKSEKVSLRQTPKQIVSQSIALSEEFTLTTAELSYLQDRKVAYENLANRTGLEGVKSVCLALQQSERYGTPLGQSLRVMAQENRDMRMNEAEKKAAALPPKLTVPMILFFLPVLFVVILGPTGIRVAAMQ
jgi:pilus assembly protein TadC